METIQDQFLEALKALKKNPEVPIEFAGMAVGVSEIIPLISSGLSNNFIRRIIKANEDQMFVCENCCNEAKLENLILINPQIAEKYHKPEVVCRYCVYKVFEDILLEILEREDFHFNNLLNLDCEETIGSVKELEDGISFLTFFRIVETLYEFNNHVHLHCVHCGNLVPKDSMALIDTMSYSCYEHQNLDSVNDISYQNQIYLPVLCHQCYNMYENAREELRHEIQHDEELIEVLTNYTPFTAENVSVYRESYDEAWIRRVYSKLDNHQEYEESVLFGKEYRIYKGYLNFDKISENIIVSNDERDIFNVLASRHTCYNPNTGSCSNAYRVCSENQDYILLVKNPDNENIYDIILRHVDSDLYYIEPFAYEALTYSEQYSEKICSSKILSKEDINELQKKLHIRIYSSDMIGFHYEGVIHLSESIYVDKDSRTESEIEIKKEKKFEEIEFMGAQFFIFDKRIVETANCKEIIEVSIGSTEKKIEKISKDLYALGKPRGKYIIGNHNGVVKTNMKAELASFINKYRADLSVYWKYAIPYHFIEVESVNEIASRLTLDQASTIHALVEAFPNSYLNFPIDKITILEQLSEIKARKPNETKAFTRLIESLAIANYYPFIKKYLVENKLAIDNFSVNKKEEYERSRYGNQ